MYEQYINANMSQNGEQEYNKTEFIKDYIQITIWITKIKYEINKNIRGNYY